jgi:exodeoxyribonuclease VII large subunit
VLERGYSLARAADGKLLTRAADAAPGDAIRVTLAEGALDCRVEKVSPPDARDEETKK